MTTHAPFVLIVDDSHDARDVLAEYLRYLGYEVIEASGGQVAVDYARECPPALIFTAPSRRRGNPNQTLGNEHKTSIRLSSQKRRITTEHHRR
jgi:DNA-binding NtrC family response regulator